MNAKELLELDKWIHVNIFSGDKLVGLKKRGLWYRPKQQGYTDKQSEAGRYTLEEAKLHEYPYDEPVTICEFQPPLYATDPAAAMLVLKKCCSNLSENGFEVTIGHHRYSITESRQWMVCSSNKRGHQSFSESLEQTICLFAKKLFTK